MAGAKGCELPAAAAGRTFGGKGARYAAGLQLVPVASLFAGAGLCVFLGLVLKTVLMSRNSSRMLKRKVDYRELRGRS